LAKNHLQWRNVQKSKLRQTAGRLAEANRSGKIEGFAQAIQNLPKLDLVRAKPILGMIALETHTTNAHLLNFKIF
jgi:hypothetical protein